MKRILQNGLLLIALTIGVAFRLSAQSTQVTIHLNDGTEDTYYMSGTDRVYFEDNEFLVVEVAVNAKSQRYLLADIRKITCSETEGLGETTNSSVILSPNPVHNAFMLRNLKGKETLQIYALDGRLMKSLEASPNQMVDISDLPIGLYLVKTERQTLKMIKL